MTPRNCAKGGPKLSRAFVVRSLRTGYVPMTWSIKIATEITYHLRFRPIKQLLNFGGIKVSNQGGRSRRLPLGSTACRGGIRWHTYGGKGYSTPPSSYEISTFSLAWIAAVCCLSSLSSSSSDCILSTPLRF
jgi:hypothetical protein